MITDAEIKRLRLIEKMERFRQIGCEAVRKVQKENRERGIPSVLIRNGKEYFEMPDGTITMENPFV